MDLMDGGRRSRPRAPPVVEAQGKQGWAPPRHRRARTPPPACARSSMAALTAFEDIWLDGGARKVLPAMGYTCTGCHHRCSLLNGCKDDGRCAGYHRCYHWSMDLHCRLKKCATIVSAYCEEYFATNLPQFLNHKFMRHPAR
jgi:hypothetical protein